MTNQLTVHKRFKTLAAVMYVLSFIVMGMLGLVLASLIIVGFILAIVPVDELMGIISNIPMNHSFEGGGISLTITDEVLTSFNPDMTMLIFVMVASLLSIGVMLVIVILVNRWLRNLKNGEILTINNSKYIEYIGYSFVVYAVMEMITKLTTSLFISSSIAVSELPGDLQMFILSDSTSIDINLVPVFAGILIWMIAKSFKYGAFLQDEYDATV